MGESYDNIDLGLNLILVFPSNIPSSFWNNEKL